MSLVLLFQLDLVSEVDTASLSLLSRVSVQQPQTLDLDARVSVGALRTLALLAAASAEKSSLLDIIAAVQGISTKTLNVLAAIQRVKYQSLSFNAQMRALPQKTLAFNSLVATDVHSYILGLVAKAQADATATLGIYGNVHGVMFKRMNLKARITKAREPILGLLAFISEGSTLSFFSRISVTTPTILGINAVVTEEGVFGGNQVRFFPDDDRVYEGWGHSPPTEAVARYLTEGETQFLAIRYVNYPNPASRADLAWIWDDVYLPVNAAELTFAEPPKETVFETVAARSIVISETELETPRATRSRSFELTWGPVGVQLVRWFAMRLRTGAEFYAEMHLFDARGEDSEEAWSDPSDSDTYLTWYWGNFPSWKPGTVTVSVNSVGIPDDGSTYRLHYAPGAVEFLSPLGSDDVVEIQYAYRPKFVVSALDYQPATGFAFNSYKVKLTLQEVD